MPTLIRLFLFLVILAGIGFTGMLALTVLVDPGEKDITIKIPVRELVPANKPIDLNNLPAPVNIAPKDSPSGSPTATSTDTPSIDTTDSAASQPGVKTEQPGAPE